MKVVPLTKLSQEELVGGEGNRNDTFSFEHVQLEMPTGPAVENAQSSGKEIYVFKSLI